MATAKQIIDKAKSFIGVKENPPYSNNVIFNTDYYGHPVNGSAYPWCCTFVWDIFRMCGASNLFFNGNKTASCTAVLNWARANGLIVNNSSGRAGDIILFDWDCSGDADHIGLIIEKNSNGSYTTVEGNTSLTNNSNGGEVMERNRRDYIRAIIRPKYDVDELRYRVHQQTYGDLPWVEEGECAGWTGKSKRVESICIESPTNLLEYMVHQQSYGDSKWYTNGQWAGVKGQSKRLEGFAVKCKGRKIRYKGHLQGTGWTKWYYDGEYCGTKGQSRRLEAIIIEFC